MSERNVIHENFHTKHSVLTAPDEHMPYIIQLHIMSLRWTYYEQMKQQNIWSEKETETDRERQRQRQTEWDREPPSNNHKLGVGGRLAELSPDVHGEEGAGAVEDGVQVAHQRRYHHRHHQTPSPWKSNTAADGNCDDNGGDNDGEMMMMITMMVTSGN